MKIFDWLLGKNPKKTDAYDFGWTAMAAVYNGKNKKQLEEEAATEPRKFHPVPKWTHAGKKGKDIWCPKCSEKTHVYHFGWAAMLCRSCHAVVDKYNWLMPVKTSSK
jgi:hypothetical protein|tara:strand:- start:1184 stop:1504 length:321 start_codon:yes stop_codon:yes gene_type:complete